MGEKRRKKKKGKERKGNKRKGKKRKRKERKEKKKNKIRQVAYKEIDLRTPHKPVTSGSLNRFGPIDSRVLAHREWHY